jgi:hypothetical protein
MYLCDGKVCGEGAYCGPRGEGECWHTTKREHALHPDADLKGFIAIPGREPDKVDLWEPDDEG